MYNFLYLFFKKRTAIFLGQRNEGLRWRPRHSETMKGADTGDTLRGVGNKHRSEDSRIGQPLMNSFLNS